MAEFRRVLVGPKVDLDTCGAILCALYDAGLRCEYTGAPVGEEAAEHAFWQFTPLPIEIVRKGRASEADLADPLALCVEVGGAGRVEEGNFDHHEVNGPTVSATRQAYEFFNLRTPELGRLVEYIHRLDTEGPRAFGVRKEGTYLSDLFAGMLLTERDPAAQVREGILLLAQFLGGQRFHGWDPFDPLSENDLRVAIVSEMWPRWAEAKRENNRALAETLERASWGTTRSGRRLAWLESNFFGAPGALYGHGAEIAVVYNPAFGTPPVRKFTIAGNNVVVAPALERVNVLESGWGGPATGTILGSPREGSSLTLEQVVEVVRETL